MNKQIHILLNSQSKEIESKNEILKEVETFYTNLYKSEETMYIRSEITLLVLKRGYPRKTVNPSIDQYRKMKYNTVLKTWKMGRVPGKTELQRILWLLLSHNKTWTDMFAFFITHSIYVHGDVVYTNKIIFIINVLPTKKRDKHFLILQIYYDSTYIDKLLQ